MATHSSILSWETPSTEEPSRAGVRGLAKESDKTEQPNNNKEKTQQDRGPACAVDAVLTAGPAESGQWQILEKKSTVPS